MSARSDNSEPSSARTDTEHGEAAVNWAIRSGRAARVRANLALADRQARSRRRALAGGALVASLCCFLGWQVLMRKNARVPDAAVVVAAHSEATSSPLSEILPDGSLVERSRGSNLEVKFDPNQRRITLLRGEAHFTVVKDSARPFIVIAAGIEAKAVGTAFAMTLSDSGVEVLVTEGVVAVDRSPSLTPMASSSASMPLAVVAAGTRVVVDVEGSNPVRPVITPLSSHEIDARLSWRVRRLTFKATPLSEVLPMFNQSAGSRITLADPGLGTLQITGVLRADNPDSILELLQLAFHVKVERGEHEIILRR